MIKQKVTVGPHFESSEVMRLVQKASEFRSHVSFILGEKTANAKSIMGIISLNLQTGHEVEIMADGDDESTVVASLKLIIAS